MSTITEAHGQRVEGIIYDIPEKEILELDILEDIPLGLYRRDGFLVLGEDQPWYTANLYRVVKLEGPFATSAKYVEMMITGATEHQLSAAYIEKLISLRSITVQTEINHLRNKDLSEF
ncbi:MAG: gamma-glutamylcyclotransferase [Chloroflexota bacterium]